MFSEGIIGIGEFIGMWRLLDAYDAGRMFYPQISSKSDKERETRFEEMRRTRAISQIWFMERLCGTYKYKMS
jgi:hypothetical protein